MNRKQIMAMSMSLMLIIGGVWTLFIAHHRTRSATPTFITTTPDYRPLNKKIYCSGQLIAHNSSKIGSLVSGTVDHIYVSEDDTVTKGQLLLTINTGKNTTEIDEARGEVVQAQARYDYLKTHLERQKQLLDRAECPRDHYEKKMRDLQVAKGTLATKQAKLARKEIEYENTRIRAPRDGVIIAIGVNEGERVSTDADAPPLCEIADDRKHLMAELAIDENDISMLAPGQKVILTSNAFPHKKIIGAIAFVSYRPITHEQRTSFSAQVHFENNCLPLFPGMKVYGYIIAAHTSEACCIPAAATQIKKRTLTQALHNTHYVCKPLSKKEKQAKKEEKTPCAFVWIQKQHALVEKPITVGIATHTEYEVINGLNDNDTILLRIASAPNWEAQ